MERHLSKLAVIQRENERWAEKRRLLLKRMGKEVDMDQECDESRPSSMEFTLDETFRIIFMPGEDDIREVGRMSAILEESQGESPMIEELQRVTLKLEESQEVSKILEESQEMLQNLEDSQEGSEVLEESQEVLQNLEDSQEVSEVFEESQEVLLNLKDSRDESEEAEDNIVEKEQPATMEEADEDGGLK